MTDKYILRGHEVVPADNLMDWGKWFQTANRHVARDLIGDARISTVFLGLDHSFGGPKPLVFETMIFGGEHDDYCERCSTWEEAEEQHRRAVEMVRGKQ